MRNWIINQYARADRLGYAIGAFNFSTLDIMKGTVAAAKKLKAPIIISCSEGERHFFGAEEAVAVYHVLRKQYPHIILHADHTKSLKEYRKVIDAGFPSAHFDGSGMDYKENLTQTLKAASMAHKADVFIEGEIGGILGGSTTHKQSVSSVVNESTLTHPDEAESFARITGVDSLAVSVGNAHGLWKGGKHLDFPRIAEIKKRTNKFLVLHGGSGISTAHFRKAISLGVVKININTETRIAYTDALLKGLHHREDYTPYKYLQPSRDAVQKEVEEKLIMFKAKNRI